MNEESLLQDTAATATTTRLKSLEEFLSILIEAVSNLERFCKIYPRVILKYGGSKSLVIRR
jgi:hypothetical protein